MYLLPQKHFLTAFIGRQDEGRGIMRKVSIIVGSILALVIGVGTGAGQPYPSDLAHTYSIVARDSVTGELGVAVQTHWFAVGRRVAWAEPGVGAVATQSFTNPSFGPRGLEMLREGWSPQQTVDSLIASDPGRERRQLAIVDARGGVATWTGRQCIAAAGHAAGNGYSVQANLMESDAVWPAMARAYENASGPLAERLLAALEAAEAAGGDIRGKQSAALLVVSSEVAPGPWAGRIVDLRVDDSREPLVELRRLLQIHRAYEHMNRGGSALDEDDLEKAYEQYERASTLYPDNPEFQFWFAVSLANKGLVTRALPIFAEVFAENYRWRTLTARLPDSDRLNVTDSEMRQILNVTLPDTIPAD